MDKTSHKRRKKPVLKCPNPLFMFWLTEWYEEAAGRDLKTRFTYAKVSFVYELLIQRVFLVNCEMLTSQLFTKEVSFMKNIDLLKGYLQLIYQ